MNLEKNEFELFSREVQLEDERILAIVNELLLEMEH